MLVSNGKKELGHKVKYSGVGFGSVVVLLLAVLRSSNTTSTFSTSCTLRHRKTSLIVQVDIYAN